MRTIRATSGARLLRSQIAALAACLAAIPGVRSAAGAEAPPPGVPADAAARELAEPGGFEVAPSSIVLQGKWAEQRLLVTRRGLDGSASDWTGQVAFQSANPAVATVDAAGAVRPAGDGETAIAVQAIRGANRYLKLVPVVVKGAQAAHVEFNADVVPILARAGCNAAACHGAAAGQGELKLSLFAGDPDADFAALTGAKGKFVNKADPDHALLVAKLTATTPHKGGKKLEPGSREATIIRAWIGEGSPRGGGPPGQVASLAVEPDRRTLARGQSQRFVVTATFADGSRRDVTALATFRSSDPKVITIDGSGQAKVAGVGASAVVAEYQRHPAVARLIVPSDLPFAFPDVPVNNRVDELVLANLKALRIPPSELASEEVFLRRVYLDVIGTLPTPDEVRSFLADKAPTKRAALIDGLLRRPEFAQYWAVKWGDLLRIKSEYPVNVWPKAVHVYDRWLRDRLARDVPYDRLVRELLTAGGSNFRSPAANYYRAMPGRDPQSFAEATALVFMGTRINCAHCHGHPTEPWTEDDNLGLSAFFAKVGFKPTQEWKEEIVFFNADGGIANPRTKAGVRPKLPGAPPLDLPPDADPRVKFAEWLTSKDNPYFATNIVNRIWAWLMGRGLVEPADDIRPSNPAENPELLAYLRDELVNHGFDLKHVYRLILNSRTYQLSSEPTPLNEPDRAHFSHRSMRRLSAEQYLDAICQVLDSHEVFSSWIPVPPLYMPRSRRAVQLPDSDIDSAFLELFGRPSRDTSYEGDRNNEAQPRQSLYLVSSDELEWRINDGKRVKALMESKLKDPEVVDEVYLSAFSRPPRDDEKARAVAHLAKNPAARWQATQDLLWAVFTSKEFLVNH
ncbi:DUF1549 and DUF1553 domain-containing protein [Aquisphaera insulae]|uniref:DUF1549 and DUF1553 domain-containing protein n=1 Tax=Aquisphaera insulae TaxID=2712864 RepID=UPI0013EE30AB|nr:DUF1549 and DUF1553 domain-containing protein [Aquisphaera insulae]